MTECLQEELDVGASVCMSNCLWQGVAPHKPLTEPVAGQPNTHCNYATLLNMGGNVPQ